MNIRYYLWKYSKAYGWQQLGRTSGYASLNKLIKDQQALIAECHEADYKIMKALPIRTNLCKRK